VRPLTPEAFRKWLRYVRGSRRFAKGSCDRCPLAQYTGEEIGANALPPWAFTFMASFDSSPGGTHLGKVGVLRILNKVAPRQ
jgi:hypothetical protein